MGGYSTTEAALLDGGRSIYDEVDTDSLAAPPVRAGAAAESPTALPPFSVIVPVFNEAEMLDASIRLLHRRLTQIADEFEILVCDNGSTDATVQLGYTIAGELPNVRVFSLPGPNYGRAFREGVLRSRSDYIFCFDLDFWDVDFIRRSFEDAFLAGNGVGLAVASKQLAASNDQRPAYRRLLSRMYNRLLHGLFGFTGTETHGVKGFLKSLLAPVLDSCVTDNEVLASEFVIRAERAGVKRKEFPIACSEQRAPRLSLFRRAPSVIKNIFVLYREIHRTPAPAEPGILE